MNDKPLTKVNTGKNISGGFTDRQKDTESTPEFKEHLKDLLGLYGGAYVEDEIKFQEEAARNPKSLNELLERYEKKVAADFVKMINIESNTNLSLYDIDKAENIGVLTAEKTIEAAAGNVFQARRAALKEAIENSNSSSKEEDLKIGDDLFYLHAKHFHYGNTPIELGETWHQRYMKLASSHNELIRYLNLMNKTAKRYGVTPFTPRDFRTNDFRYNKEQDPGSYTDRRTELDRSIVEYYCINAFPNDHRKMTEDNWWKRL